jgi:type I restriction enzyme, S subunit
VTEWLFEVANDNWELSTLGEVCQRGGGNIQTGPFGSQLHAADYVPIGIPSIMPQNLSNDRISIVDIARITLEDAERLSRYRVQIGDIVYSRRGDVERRALVTEIENGWLCGTGCLRVRFGEGVVDPVYAYYYLGHPNVRAWVVRHAIGATLPNLNTSILSALPFVLPSLEEQRYIASVLGSLDDKIESNRRENETLETTARALFKSWFVDFDPVRAKMEGRQSAGMDSEIAALFPDSFEESALGLIPAGWRVMLIGDLVRVVGGSTPSTDRPEFWQHGTIYWATPKDLSALSDPVLLDTERRITELGLKQISSGLLPIGTVLMSSRAPIGYLAISEIQVAINQGFIAMVCEIDLPNHYALHWSRENMDVIISRANGTTFLEISKSNFRPMPVVVPSQEILSLFADYADELHRKVAENLREIRTLAETRDALLPKLLSGETEFKKSQ